MTIRDSPLLMFAITPEQAEQERQICYKYISAKRGWRDLNLYTYPKGSTITIETTVKSNTESIGNITHNSVLRRINKAEAIEVFITVPSKANIISPITNSLK